VSARLLLAGSAVVAAALVLAYVALGGGDFRPPETADACEPRPFAMPQTNAELGEQLVVAAIDGAACELGVSREQVLLAFGSETGRERLQARHDLADEEVEDALRAGLLRAVDEAERADAIGGTTALLLRIAAQAVPLDAVLDRLRDLDLPG
jgi:hypothetical protein